MFRADLDGRNAITIAALNIELPTGLTIGESGLSIIVCICVLCVVGVYCLLYQCC